MRSTNALSAILSAAALLGIGGIVFGVTGEGSERAAQRLLRAYPRSSTALAIHGDALFARGDRERARAEFERALAMGPDDPATATSVRKAFESYRRPAALWPQMEAASHGFEARANVKTALVIGNSHYGQGTDLANPATDARLLATTLRHIGFEVTEVYDAGYDAMISRLAAFSQQAARADIALVYFAGHGQEGNAQALLPTDALVDSARPRLVSLDSVLSAMSGARKLRVAIIDACRKEPLTATALAAVATPKGETIVAFAASHGQAASDGDHGNSPYASSLAERIKTPRLDVRKMLGLVRDDVFATTNRTQEPYTLGSQGAKDVFLNDG